MGPTLGHLAHFRAQKLVCVLSRITEGADGQLWMPDPEGLRRYQDGRCVLHHIEQVEKTALTESCFPFVRFGRDRVLAMVPDRIIEYDAAGHRSNTLKMTVDAGLLQFTGMASGPDGRSPDHRAHGDREVARHHKLENGPFFLSAAAGLSDLQFPLTGKAGELFMTARCATTRKRSLVRFVRDS